LLLKELRRKQLKDRENINETLTNEVKHLIKSLLGVKAWFDEAVYTAQSSANICSL
jgi:hypothetical protein